MKDDLQRQAQQIRLWRKRRKMTLENLARKLGTSAGHLHKWETGKVSVNVDRLDDIARVLEVGLHDLLLDPSRFNSIPVIGVLDHFGRVEIIEDFASGDPLKFVDAPDGVDVDSGAAIEVAGDALQPIPNGWLVYFNRTYGSSHYGGIANEAVGGLCVTKISDAPQMLVRRVGEGSKPPYYNLFSPHTTEILDIELDWAAPVVCLRPMPKTSE
ncbi:MAG: transcriptional regulator with XRE-family HTH domain [Paracoccaceae bacterium]|jgi:transcriptional regulator with XRE-family HTH domain